MKKWKILILVLIGIIGMAGASEKDDLFQTGEKWIYKHQGPKPGSLNPKKLNGDRIRKCLSSQGNNENKRWVVEEKYPTEEGFRYFIDRNRLVNKIETGFDTTVHFNPPIPFDCQILQKDEEKEYHSEFNFGRLLVSYMVKSKRLKNETVIVPAGEFNDCHHYHNITIITFRNESAKTVIRLTQDVFYHPKAHGIVMEISKRSPVDLGGKILDGQTSTSVLKFYHRGG